MYIYICIYIYTYIYANIYIHICGLGLSFWFEGLGLVGNILFKKCIRLIFSYFLRKISKSSKTLLKPCLNVLLCVIIGQAQLPKFVDSIVCADTTPGHKQHAALRCIQMFLVQCHMALAI